MSAQVLAYRIGYRHLSEPLDTAKGSTNYPKVTVTGGSGPVGAAVTRLIDARVTAERRTFAADAADAASGDGESEQEITVAGQSRWGWLYSVRFTDYRGVAGTAHPVTNLFAVTVDLRTGREVRAADVFARPAQVDVAVRAALEQRGVEPEASGMVTVGPVTDVGGATTVDTSPTPTGLWVGLSQCVATCALGAVEVTVPWNRLPTPRPGVLPPASR